jgi:hypothetical protein
MELASIGGHGVLSTLAIHSSCAKIWLWVTKRKDNIKIIIALLPRYRICGEWDKVQKSKKLIAVIHHHRQKHLEMNNRGKFLRVKAYPLAMKCNDEIPRLQ